jgi:glycosyltransferase involved in cell wall biosynthesis
MISDPRAQLFRRCRQLRDLLASEGVTGISDRTRRTLAGWVAPKAIVMPVRPKDVLAADLSRPAPPSAVSAPRGALRVNWVCTPPSPGSGGHSTLFRMIRYLEAHGYANRVYFYDVYGGDHRYYESIVRGYYRFAGPVSKVEDGMADADAVVATAWPTAYPVFNARCAGRRFYFVQDFEPSFHPVGALSVLAENTYRMGFHGITAGAWLAEKLKADYGMETDHFEFGCDNACYRRMPDSHRRGVVFYARPDTARRGVELGLMAIELFAARRPDIEIHLYGDRMGRLPFAFHDHGRITPEHLNEIYNCCYAGMSLSLTNVSLVPHEMLAAGCIPIVNDALHNRMVLRNPYVRYVPLNPHALAAELEKVVGTPDFDTLSAAASASVRATTWEDAAAMVDAALRLALLGPPAKGGEPAGTGRGMLVS